MSAKVLAPDGHEWVVRRRWVPRLGTESLWGRFYRRLRRSRRRDDNLDDDGGDLDADPGGCLDALDEGIFAVLAVVAIVLLAYFVVIPLLVAIVDLLILLLIFVLSLAARVVFRRPWIVEARSNNSLVWRWRIAGWRASGEKVTEIRQLIAAGAPLPVDAEPG